MGEEAIVTGIDALVKYLSEHGETDSVSLAYALNTTEKTIEDWANVLEKAGMVRISYRVGKMYIAIPTNVEAASKELMQNVEVRKSILEGEIKGQINVMDKLNQKLDELKKATGNAEGAFRGKAGNIKKELDKLAKIEKEVNENYAKVKERRDYMDRLVLNLQQQFKAVSESAEYIKGMSPETGGAGALMADIKAKILASDQSTKDLLAKFESSVVAQRKELQQLAVNVKDENSKLRETVAQEEKKVEEYSKKLSSLKSGSQSLNSRVEKEKGKILDDAAKARQEIEKEYSLAEQQMAKLRTLIAGGKEGFGGFATLNDNLEHLSTEIERISKEKDQLSKEYNTLLQQLRALDSLSGKKAFEKKSRLEAITGKSRKASKRLDDAVQAASKAGDEAQNIA